jgi:hypothetical protein
MSGGLQLGLPLPPFTLTEAQRWRTEVDRLAADLSVEWPDVRRLRKALDEWLRTPTTESEEVVEWWACRVGLLDGSSRKLRRLKRLIESGVAGRAADVLADGGRR